MLACSGFNTNVAKSSRAQDALLIGKLCCNLDRARLRGDLPIDNNDFSFRRQSNSVCLDELDGNGFFLRSVPSYQPRNRLCSAKVVALADVEVCSDRIDLRD